MIAKVLSGCLAHPQTNQAPFISPSQLGRVFVDAYSKTPLTQLTTVRTEQLARLLREIDPPIEHAMADVGWHSRGHAAHLFRQAAGITRPVIDSVFANPGMRSDKHFRSGPRRRGASGSPIIPTSAERTS